MTKIVTASTVRAYFAADAKRVEGLSEKAAHTVAKGARGRLHPDAIKAFNAKRRKDARYTPGQTTQAREAAKAEAKAQREALVAKGVTVGTRGPLPGTTRKAAAKPKGTTPKA